MQEKENHPGFIGSHTSHYTKTYLQATVQMGQPPITMNGVTWHIPTVFYTSLCKEAPVTVCMLESTVADWRTQQNPKLYVSFSFYSYRQKKDCGPTACYLVATWTPELGSNVTLLGTSASLENQTGQSQQSKQSLWF